MAKDPEMLAHQEWLGFVQPVGLVVSVPAMLQAQAYVNRNIAPAHGRFLACLSAGADGAPPTLVDFPAFTRSVLEWEPADLVSSPEAEPLPASLEVALPEYHETLRPTWAVREFKPKDPARPWLMLIQSVPAGTELDRDAGADDSRHWQASPQAKFERLLRETQVPIGVLTNRTHVRLVYAPRGETSGHATFSVAHMATVAGRPIFAALHMLLSAERLFSLPDKQRLPAILADSRKYQNLVSTQLAEQVLAALYELVRGFQAADAARNGALLRDVLKDDPNHVYGGLLTVLMRLVFVLYAEDRGLISTDPLYTNHYSVTGLFDRLRADAGRYPDTMDQRYGAWAQLLTLFRLVYHGGSHGSFRIPARRGYLFDPDRYAFLEGRPRCGGKDAGDSRIDVPRVSDGIVYNVLSDLLILGGERLSYRTLDVEQIGSVYETMMGFDLEVAAGRSIAIKPAKSHGAPAAVNLDELLATKPADRAKWLVEWADQKLTGQAAEALKKAGSVDDLLAALDKKIAKRVMENAVPKGAMVLQPSDERRRSGSHYTPRSLTEPIVRKTLEPVLKRLGETGPPTPEQILDLKVCDPAMGSGAFLVEACRQLGDELVKAWHAHGKLPRDIPPDEDEVLHARRLVAQRCLYGVDRNPMAVDLAKLSLWLATLARDHPFTFLDHALRHGDSLVGLTGEQIADFHWQPIPGRLLGQEHIEQRIEDATRYRREILEAGDRVPHETKQQKLAVADDRLDAVRFFGNLVVSAFFAQPNDRKRKEARDSLLEQLRSYLTTADLRLRPIAAAALRGDQRPVVPFHWGVEFPEVYGRTNPGFDAVVGNPPFMGGSKISSALGRNYLEWLLARNLHAHGNSDVVAYFFRRAFESLRHSGALGMLATNTIAQGDTRVTGLRWICEKGGEIYSANKRVEWPGLAAVVLSSIHISRGSPNTTRRLDGRQVDRITAFLFHRGGNDDPSALMANAGKVFVGSAVYGQGFIFDDDDSSGIANTLSAMERLIARDARNAERIFPFIGGEEVNDSPVHAHQRYVINFGQMSLEEAKRWPDLLEVVRERVKPVRDKLREDTGPGAHGKKWWWQFQHPRQPLYEAIENRHQVLVISRVTTHMAFARVSSNAVFSHKLCVLPDAADSSLCVLQSRVHEVWARFFSSTLGDALNYSPSDCFETFPFPGNFESDPDLQAAGKTYYEFRAGVMIRNDEGLTKTYNRFHDPFQASADIIRLRELHAAMDRAVFDAYGWADLRSACGFGLDHLDADEDDVPDDLAATLWCATAAEATTFASRLPAARRRLPWRHRWPDDTRDEVLARLLALNQKRAEEERITGRTAELSKKPANKAAKAKGGGKKASGASLPVETGLWKTQRES